MYENLIPSPIINIVIAAYSQRLKLIYNYMNISSVLENVHYIAI